jgi:hypothetical protein
MRLLVLAGSFALPMGKFRDFDGPKQYTIPNLYLRLLETGPYPSAREAIFSAIIATVSSKD